MSININRDVEQYQESVVFGLNAKQAVAALLALAVGTGMTCALYFAACLPIQVSIYLSLPFCIPILLPVLGTQYGLTVAERIRQSNKRKRVLSYGAVPVKKENGTTGGGRKQKKAKTGQMEKKKGMRGWRWNGKEKESTSKGQVPPGKE